MHTPPPRRLEAMTALLSPAALQGAGPLARLMRQGGLQLARRLNTSLVEIAQH